MKGKTGDGETVEPSREVFEKFNIKKLIFRRMREKENIIISILCAASACHNTHNLLHLILRSQGKWSAMAALKRHDNYVSWNKHIRWLYYFISFQMKCSNVFFFSPCTRNVGVKMRSFVCDSRHSDENGRFLLLWMEHQSPNLRDTTHFANTHLEINNKQNQIFGNIFHRLSTTW